MAQPWHSNIKRTALPPQVEESLRRWRQGRAPVQKPVFQPPSFWGFLKSAFGAPPGMVERQAVIGEKNLAAWGEASRTGRVPPISAWPTFAAYAMPEMFTPALGFAGRIPKRGGLSAASKKILEKSAKDVSAAEVVVGGKKPIIPKAGKIIPKIGIKEPWQMSKSDYDSLPSSRLGGSKDFGVTDAEAEYGFRFNAERSRLLQKAMPTPESIVKRIVNEKIPEHKMIVQQALSEGKSVPANVLKDYPDLIKQPQVKPVIKPAETKQALTKGAVPPKITPEPEMGRVPMPPEEDQLINNIFKQQFPRERRATPRVTEVPPAGRPVAPAVTGGRTLTGIPVTPGPVPPAGLNIAERLWLPEPPRTGAYMASARKEVAGSFKGKTAALDVVEQARQQVLKARDMGENAINYVSSYIRDAGNLTKEFGLDATGTATRVANPGNRSLSINDVLSSYTHYDLTPVQKEIAIRHGFVYKEALKLAKSYGVEVKTLGGPDEFWQYIARRVKTRVDPVTGQVVAPPPVIGGFKMGSKVSAQKERVFEQMAEGVDLGYLYAHPDEAIAQHIKGIYRLIGNKQAETTVTSLTRQITKEAPLVFGERRLGQPALQQRATAVDIANAIDKIFSPEQEIKALRVAADISGAVVGQVAALDVSAPFIQGLTVLGHDLKMALKGKPSAVWAQSYGHMWKAVANPETINNFRNANQPLYKRALEAGVMTGQSEFVSGVPLAGRVLGKLPVMGRTLQEFYRQTWGRMGAAYSDFLEVARIKLFEQMEGAWQRQGANVYDLGALINRMSGTTSAAARGVGANRRLLERTAAFAPNYLRSSLLLMKDMVGRGATAKEVQSTIATLLGVGFMVYYAEEKVRDREPKIKPWPKRLGGDGAEAFTTEIAGQRVGLGSWMYSMIKTVAEVGAIAVDDPSALVVWNNAHPIARFAKSKMGPGLSLATELATGRNFWGQPFDSYTDYLRRIVESGVPIAGQSLLEKQTPATGETLAEKVTPIITSLMGARSFPYTLQSQWTDAGAFKDYNGIPASDIERQAGKFPLSRTQYRMRNPDVDAKLFISGQVSSLESFAAVQQVLTLIQENKIDPDTISGIAAAKRTAEQRAKAGLPSMNTLIDQLLRRLENQILSGGVPPVKGTGAATPSGVNSQLENSMLEKARSQPAGVK